MNTNSISSPTKLLFERGGCGPRGSFLPPLDVPAVEPPEALRRKASLPLPNLTEGEISRHYAALSRKVHGVCDGFYPLGSCTMKYNPKIDEEVAALPGFTGVHPLQPPETSQGCLALEEELSGDLCEISGMDAMTLQPAAGAHGEFTGLLLIKSYLAARGELGRRNKILVPDSAHGTNPASAAMCGFSVVHIPSTEDGCVDLDALRAAVGEDTAGLMLTNPNTVGVFDHNILKVTQIVHENGGLCYYDGANLNAVMGVVRPGDMGFDCIHINLHKTFATPHGGGGPGAGPVGCKAFLSQYLPGERVVREGGSLVRRRAPESMGDVKVFGGNFLVCVRALAYIATLGRDGIPEAAKHAVLNANYMLAKLKDTYSVAFTEGVMHEFVLSLEDLHKETGVAALDIAKGLLDRGIHPPTMYFPLIVQEALMIEPTETESKQTLDEAIEALLDLAREAHENPDALHAAPVRTPVTRLDETRAANPKTAKLCYDFDAKK